MFHFFWDSVTMPNLRVTKVLVENRVQSKSKLGNNLKNTGNTGYTSCELAKNFFILV